MYFLIDKIRQKFGFKALIHASSLMEGATAISRASLGGGKYRWNCWLRYNQMKQNEKNFLLIFLAQSNKISHYLLLMSSETNPFPRPVIGTFRGYAEENKIIIGEDSYSIEEIDFVCMYRHSSRIKQEERVNSNPFQGLVSLLCQKKSRKS